ncbi:MAG: FAD-binding protein [Planctomycetota bacterium]
MFSQPLAAIVQQDCSLAEHCWLKIGGTAKYFAEIANADLLAHACREAAENNLAVRVLGGGSNLLIRNDIVDGLVIKLTGNFETIEVLDGRIRAGAAASLGEVISRSAEKGLAGLEHLAGIPGSVGAAVVSNSGIKNDDLGSKVQKVSGINRDGELVDIERAEMKFGYRRSNLDHLILTSVELKVEELAPEEVTRRLQANWIVQKAAQPPEDDRIAQAFIEPSGWRIAELLEAAGMKSASEGEVSMHPSYPGFLCVNSGATAAEVLSLMDRISKAVEVQFGIQLQPQLKIW